MFITYGLTLNILLFFKALKRGHMFKTLKKIGRTSENTHDPIKVNNRKTSRRTSQKECQMIEVGNINMHTHLWAPSLTLNCSVDTGS